MLEIFPFLAWLAAIVSATLLAVLWRQGELPPLQRVLLLGYWLVAGYCQFFGGTLMVGALGLLLQTMLAVYLLIRFRAG